MSAVILQTKLEGSPRAQAKTALFQDEALPPELAGELKEPGIIASHIKKRTEAGANTTQTILPRKRKQLLSVRGLSGDACDKVADVASNVSAKPSSLMERPQTNGAEADIKRRRDGTDASRPVAAVERAHLLSVRGFSNQALGDAVEVPSKSALVGVRASAQPVAKMQACLALSSGSSGLDQMLGGGFQGGSITQLVGESRCGKTQLCHSLAVMAQLAPAPGGASGKVMYIDTEGTFRPERVRQIAVARSVGSKVAMDNIIYARCFTSEHLVHLLVEAARLMERAEDRFALVVVDSIISVFRADYPGRDEIPERQQKLGLVLSNIQRMGEEFKVVVVLTNQVMAEPGDACGAVPNRPRALGGQVLERFSTSRVYLRRGRGEQRVAELQASARIPGSECAFEIFEGGIRDASHSGKGAPQGPGVIQGLE